MKLSKLHECTTTAAIADRASGLFSGSTPPPPKRLKKKKPGNGTFPIADDYMGVSTKKHPKFGKSLVWQPQEQSKGSDWYNKDSAYAMLPNQDERLLKNFRGHGY